MALLKFLEPVSHLSLVNGEALNVEIIMFLIERKYISQPLRLAERSPFKMYITQYANMLLREVISQFWPKAFAT